MKDKEKLYQEYFNSLVIVPNNSKRLFFIGFIGLVGSGKSTIANYLSKTLKIPIINTDHIRRFLNSEGMSGENPDPVLLEYIVSRLNNYNCEHNISHIIDSDLIIPRYYKICNDRAKRFHAKFYLINVVCDENTIIERLRVRENNQSKSNTDNSKGDEGTYYRRKKFHEQYDLPSDIFYTIDTTNDYFSELQNLIDLIKKDEVL